MAHKTLIGGTSYEISGGKTMVGGTAYEISGGKTMVGGTVRNISFVVPQIGTLAIGSRVYMNVNGKRTRFRIVHQGLPDAAIYDTSCDGTWLLSDDIYEEDRFHLQYNDYANSEIHSYLNNTFVNLFDADIKSVIKQVKLPYTNGRGHTGPLEIGSNGISAKVFLLSYPEVGFSDYSYTNFEGAVLKYFEGADDSKRVAYFGEYETAWWLRSPYTYNAYLVWTVDSEGSAIDVTARNDRGIRPALVLPSTLLVDSKLNVIA